LKNFFAFIVSILLTPFRVLKNLIVGKKEGADDSILTTEQQPVSESVSPEPELAPSPVSPPAAPAVPNADADAQAKAYAAAKLKEIDAMIKETKAKREEQLTGKWPPDVAHPGTARKRSIADLADSELKGRR
jgi:hypothetical protein